MAIADFTLRPLTELSSLKGRRAVVTGGAAGIGAAIVRRFVEAGAEVVVGDLNLPLAEQTVASLRAEFGASCHARALDVSDSGSVSAFADSAVRTLGGLDIWVNNAGMFPYSPIMETDEASWDRIQAVNLKSVFLCSQAAGKRIIASRSTCGVIVNIASMSAFRVKRGLGHYAAAKHGVVGLTKVFAVELADHNIRVMAVAPGGTATPGVAQMLGREFRSDDVPNVPLGRAALPDDMARAALFCASDLSAYMTGYTLKVDGGNSITDVQTDRIFDESAH